MWIQSTVGFFSIVEKAGDHHGNMLTVRARAPGDLEALRATYLPTMGEIIEGAGSDYR
jgi:hypothetical protein